MYCTKCNKVVPCIHLPDPSKWNGFEQVKKMQEFTLRPFQQNNTNYELSKINQLKDLLKLSREVLHETDNYKLVLDGIDTAIVMIEELILYDMIAKTAIFQSDKPILLSHTSTDKIGK